MAITHKYTLMCDDARREDNGKIILIGLYMDAIVVNQLPFILPQLTFFSVLDADRPGHWSAEFTLVHAESGTKHVEGHVGIDVKTPGKVVLPVKFPIQVSQVGGYDYSVKIQDHEPIILSFDVRLNLPNMSSMSRQIR